MTPRRCRYQLSGTQPRPANVQDSTGRRYAIAAPERHRHVQRADENRRATTSTLSGAPSPRRRRTRQARTSRCRRPALRARAEWHRRCRTYAARRARRTRSMFPWDRAAGRWRHHRSQPRSAPGSRGRPRTDVPRGRTVRGAARGRLRTARSRRRTHVRAHGVLAPRQGSRPHRRPQPYGDRPRAAAHRSPRQAPRGRSPDRRHCASAEMRCGSHRRRS